MYEHLPPQTDWTQDFEELLLSGGPTSVSRLRPTLSARDLTSSYDHAILAPSGDQPIVEIDEDFDRDELLLRPTGHEIPSDFPISDARSDPLSRLNRQVSPSTPLTIQPPLLLLLTFLRAISPHHPLLPRFRSRQPLYHHPDLPYTEPSPMPTQERVFSFPSFASLDALAEHFLDESEHHTRTPTVT